MPTEGEQTVDGFEQVLEGFEGEVTDSDLTESLSAEDVFSRVVTDDELSNGIHRATVTRIDFGLSESDATGTDGREVCKVYYALGGLEWVAEFDPRKKRGRQKVQSFLDRYDVSRYSPADIVGRPVTVIVYDDGARLVVDADCSHSELEDAWEGRTYAYHSGLDEFGYHPFRAIPVAIACVTLLSVPFLMASIEVGIALLVIGIILSVVMGLFVPGLGLGGPDPTVTYTDTPVIPND